ncbi:hypothetical protein D3C76_1791500 [compost metagenome]
MLPVHLLDDAVIHCPVLHMQADVLVHVLLAQVKSLLMLHAAFLLLIAGFWKAPLHRSGWS